MANKPSVIRYVFFVARPSVVAFDGAELPPAAQIGLAKVSISCPADAKAETAYEWPAK
jgi:hypothetical protein